MRKRFTAVQWTAWFEEFEQSGLSVRDFCLKIDVNQNSFYRWRKKLQAQLTPDEASPFVSIALPATQQLTIEFSCGAVLLVENQLEQLELEQSQAKRLVALSEALPRKWQGSIFGWTLRMGVLSMK